MRMVTFAAVVCLLGFTLVPRAQTSIGTVSGTVKDSSGTPLPGANVRISRNGGSTQSRVTDTKGSFTFLRVPAADYDLTATLSNFAPFTVRVSVRAGGTASVAVVLTPGTVAEKAARDNAQMELSLDARTLSRAAAMSPTVAGGIAAPMAQESMPYPRPAYNTEAYDRIDENPFRRVAVDPLSTFSIDVDTASYANVRRYLNAGTLPPPDAVRIEELINYFRFDYAQPAKDVPFAVTTELAVCPWNTKHRLALVGLQSRALDLDKVPARNLVFLLDVSGSMSSPDKLPLVRTAMRMLVDTLTGRDTIAIVVYAGASGVVLPPTSGAHKETIHAAIARLEAGGSTNGAAGITLAYQVAQANFVKGGINRVILATDGDFNVGVTNIDDLARLIEEKRATGVFLSVLGVGTGNLKDATMEKLADKGNGNYSYLDSLTEARRVLIAEAGSTLVTVAKDVKIQVEFNPAQVGAYRLVGYENRRLRSRDFNDDTKDAGEMGAGHSVTALYEIVPPGEDAVSPAVDPLKYQRPATAPPAAMVTVPSNELMTVKVRYKQPDGEKSSLVTVPVLAKYTSAPRHVGFAAAVAEFGMLLRDSPFKADAAWTDAVKLATAHRGVDPEGYRAEFARLVDLAAALDRQRATTSSVSRR